MSIEIAPGASMPIIGMGTWELTDRQQLFDVIDAGLAAGYRFIDTAAAYENEAMVADALCQFLPKYSLTRKDIFITSKLSTNSQGADKALAGALKSLENLSACGDYIDLYLIHFPGASNVKTDSSENAKLRRESWLDLEKLKDQNKLRNIGVSNYTVLHLEEMRSYAKIMPVVNQCEYHPHHARQELVQFCKSNNIHFQAYSSLGTAHSKQALFDEPVVKKLAQKYNVSPGLILLNFSISQGISVLPKTRSTAHVAENLKAIDFKLESDEIDQLLELSKDKVYCWDPRSVK